LAPRQTPELRGRRLSAESYLFGQLRNAGERMAGLVVQMANAGVHFWRNAALLVAWGISLCWMGAALLRMRDKESKSRFLSWLPVLAIRGQTAAFLIIGASFAASLVLVWVLRAFPNSADEYGYIYEAETFLAGRLWNPLPPHHEYFSFLNIFDKDGKWVSEYPPGWSIVLAAGRLLYLPYWLVCPIVGTVLLFAVWKLGQRQNGSLGGILAVLLVGFSPFFLFNAASYFNVVLTATMGILFCWAMLEFFDHPNVSNALCAGAALGMAGLIRSYDAIVFGIPFAIQFLRVARRRHYALAPYIIVAGLPFLAVLLLSQLAITGSALTPVTTWGYPKLKLSLYATDHEGRQSTPLMQLAFAIFNMADLVRWTSWMLVIGYIAAFIWKYRTRQLWLLDFIFPWVVAAYLLYFGLGGNRYGPRMYLIGYPFLVLTIVSVLTPVLENKSEPKRAVFAGTLLSAHLATCIVVTIAFASFFRDVVNARMNMYDQVAAQMLHNAVVIVHSGGGAYLPFTPKDLTRNGIAIGGQDVIYALDIPGRMSELREIFPHRVFYIYSRKTAGSVGVLAPLAISANGAQRSVSPQR
jgi:Dolichyl-phosphate-mannose-protein mannosyltransferase